VHACLLTRFLMLDAVPNSSASIFAILGICIDRETGVAQSRQKGRHLIARVHDEADH
jgi:hypothetical protein